MIPGCGISLLLHCRSLNGALANITVPGLSDDEKQQEGRGGMDLTVSTHITRVALFWWIMCKTFTIVSSESSASVVSAEHCSTTSTTWSVTSVAAARGPTPMFIL